MFSHAKRLTALSFFLATLSGCQNIQYSALEQLGIEKRDILSDRVEDASDSQEDAKEEFVDALDRFKLVTDYDGGSLERVYRKINGSYEDSLKSANRVSERIDAVEQVAEDLFAEWREELDLYSSAELRSKSRTMLSDTQGRYKELLASMRTAEKSMQPVLEVLEDRVLYLKHNLNAQAIASLKSDLGEIESSTEKLVADMNRSISEANQFLAYLKDPGSCESKGDC